MPARTSAFKSPQASSETEVLRLPIDRLEPHPLPGRLYRDNDIGLEALAESLKSHGQLTPVLAESIGSDYQILSGTRRLAAARRLGWKSLEAIVKTPRDDRERELWVLESNHSRSKTFSQRMREADLLETLLGSEARRRRLANLERHQGPRLFVEDEGSAECRISDTPATGPLDSPTFTGRKGRPNRTDTLIARLVGLGGKDIYRQARIVWQTAQSGDVRAASAVELLDSGKKTVHAAFKDLHRRNHLADDFRPTPYDVWMFKHDRSYGTHYPGSIPAAIVANTVHYFSEPGELVVDPMAGGGTTLDVAASLGRRCLAYDMAPSRPDITYWNVAEVPLPTEADGCSLVFFDPPYHCMLADSYVTGSLASLDDEEWTKALRRIYRNLYASLRPGGSLAVLIANRTEKDLPAGWGYVDHAFENYSLLMNQGFQPVRRIACPMEGAYRPDQVRDSRAEKRLLGQMRDLLVVRKPPE
jgi:hypothetical protein